MHGTGMVHINSGMEQECIDKYTVNNYLGTTKSQQVQNTAAVHTFLNFYMDNGGHYHMPCSHNCDCGQIEVNSQDRVYF